MALRNIVMEGDPILEKKCRAVTQFDARLGQLIDDMGETMIENDGLGLAGPQVGTMRRLFVVLEEVPYGEEPPKPAQVAEDSTDADEETGDAPFAEIDLEAEEENERARWVVREFVNPEILEVDGKEVGYEGCLSFPGQFGAVERPTRVKVKAYDRNGKPFFYEAEGVMARCICHENDHLDGTLLPKLSAYFFDPETPHPLDETLGRREYTTGKVTPADE